MHIKIATRQSKLALIQTNLVIDKIKKYFPNADCEIVSVVTTGDKITDKNLYDIGGKALFLKELEAELIAKKVDLAVHSLKDVPGILPSNLELSAFLERGDPRDCFVSHKYTSIEDLPDAAIVGSSSVRRKVILHQSRPDLEILPCRGNIQTRLNKLGEGHFDAIILAVAGLKRLNLFDASFCFPLDVETMIPSAGQGIITVQKRMNDDRMAKICDAINDKSTMALAKAERAFLAYFDASCRTPISAYAKYLSDGRINASYMYGDFEGKNLYFHVETADPSEAWDMGLRAGKFLNYNNKQ